jgi:hypothetical protein
MPNAMAFVSTLFAVTALGATPADVVLPLKGVLPVGATIEVALDRPIGPSISHVGDEFVAHITHDVTDAGGATLIPAGAKVRGRISALQPPRGPNAPALVRLEVRSLVVNGKSYPFHASVDEIAIPGRTRADLLKRAGQGAAAGAILGAVLGKLELKDIVVGGAVGAAAGSLISLGTEGKDAVLPSGTRLTLRNARRLVIA